MYASEEPPKWSKYAELGTWVLLFVVFLPGTALGFFAETSLPNTPLYPLKRDIEQTILALSSFNNSAKTFYQLTLAKNRLQETQQIVTSQQGVTTQDLSQFNAVMSQLATANDSINSVSDPTQKAQMQLQLHETALAYKKQLSQLQQQLQSSSDTSSGTQNNTEQTTTNHYTNADVSNLNASGHTNDNTTSPNQTTDTQNTTNTTSDNTSAFPTDTSTTTNLGTPNVSNLSPEDQAALEQTIQTINDQLDTIDPLNTTESPTPFPVLPTFTPTPTPYHSENHNYWYQPTPTPWGQSDHNNGDH
jgi:hypothetical protein